MRVTRVAAQIAAFCVCAVAGGRMLYLWFRMDEEGRRRVWSLYGWFSGLMVCGSCFGAVTWSARMVQLENGFNGNDAFSRGDFAQADSFFALHYTWSSVFFVMYAIEFMCLSAARLMVLDRMSDFAAGQDEGTRKRWAAGGRMVMAVVVLGNAVGLAANIAAAVHFQRAAEAASTASALFAANSTQLAVESVSLSQTEVQLSISPLPKPKQAQVERGARLTKRCVAHGSISNHPHIWAAFP